MKAGLHDVGVSFVRRFWEPEGVLQPPQTGFGRTTNEYYHGNPAVEIVSIGGPYGAPTIARATSDERRWATGDSPSRRKVFICRPKDAASEEPCARKILSTLAARAYRRPVTELDIQTLLGFYKVGGAPDSFDAGIQRGIERILAAPSFLFRIEREPEGLAAGSAYRLSELDLASRMSFFLWSSIPDDELREAAARGKLSEPGALEQQVQRMLRDPRAKALVDNFASRWLELSKISGVVPDTELYPEFDENLREAMEQETKLFVGSQVHDNRSVVELLTADYSFLNERLAAHYGIRNIYGNHFRRVTFTDNKRGGLLGQWAVWTRRAVEMLDAVKRCRRQGGEGALDLLALGQRLTDANAALFDARNAFAGCIAGVNEVLRRQGLLATRHCLDPKEDLSPGQAEEIDRVTAAYPELTDDAFVAEYLQEWLK